MSKSPFSDLRSVFKFLFLSAPSRSSFESTRIRSVTWIAPALNASLCARLMDGPSPHVVSSSAPSAVTLSWKSCEAHAKVRVHQPCLSNTVYKCGEGGKENLNLHESRISWILLARLHIMV